MRPTICGVERTGMRHFKKYINFFVRPHFWFLILVAVIAIGAIVSVTLFMTMEAFAENVGWGYFFLGIMCVSVSYTIYGFIKIMPELKERTMKWSKNRPFFYRLFTEYGFRTIFFSIGSFVINIAFAVYNGSIAIMIRSVWFGALAAYYILLIIMRGGILFYHRRREKAIISGQSKEATNLKDKKVYGSCGIVLVLLPIALSFAILQMVRANYSFVHTGITIYAYAVYAFYKISMAIYNIIKTRQTKDVIIKASKNINLADAMVSILALQTAMFREFDTGNAAQVAKMNAITGAVVCMLTAVMGIFMIINVGKKINKQNQT